MAVKYCRQIGGEAQAKKEAKNYSVKQAASETKGNGNNFSAGEQSMRHLSARRYGFNGSYFAIKGDFHEFQ